MSYIDRKSSQIWIEENCPENGLFRVYWKDVIDDFHGGVTFDPDEGEGLRWEWYYKDGKRADGISRGWYPNGILKQERHRNKSGELDGKWTVWNEYGQMNGEWTYKNGKLVGTQAYLKV